MGLRFARESSLPWRDGKGNCDIDTRLETPMRISWGRDYGYSRSGQGIVGGDRCPLMQDRLW